MKINSYRLGWFLVTALFVGGTGVGVYFLAVGVASHQSQGIANNVPSYQRTVVAGQKVVSFPPYQPSGQKGKSPETDIPSQDKTLLHQGLPASSVIKAPDKPALPPDENNIIHIILSSQGIKPAIIKTKIFQPVILRVESQDNDYLFSIEKVGIMEVVRQGQLLTISFQAPAEAVNLRCYSENYTTRKLIGEGKIIVD